MDIAWIVVGLVILYVLKTLYEANREILSGDIPTRASLKKDADQALFVPQAPPEEINPSESLKKAEHYRVDDSDVDESFPEEIPAALITREEIPETDNIDIDCFIYFKGARLLVVEDNVLNQKIITNVLKQSGIVLDIAQNGEVAIEYLLKEEREYDMVLMDISMPVMDGITATKIIRRFPRFNSMPIVTFTAFGMGEEIDTMFEAGANAYLIKPLNIKQLYTVFMLFIGNVDRGLSQEKMLEIQGLNVKEGIENFEGDEECYLAALENFIYRFRSDTDLIGKWIDEKRYDRLRLECKELIPVLHRIGAYDMHQMVQEMQLQFVYHNEHLLDKYKLLFRAKMQALIDTIGIYLDEKQVDRLTSFKRDMGIIAPSEP